MRQNESKIQQLCVLWFNLQYRQYKGLLFAVPNGGKRDKKTVKTKTGYTTYSPTAKRLKDEGVVAGVSDLILLIPRKGFASLCIEMKTPGNDQTDLQKEWQAKVEANGSKYVVCRSLGEFQKQVTDYLT